MALLALSGSEAAAQSLSFLYVNTATGNDGNPGTLSEPLLTVNRALHLAFEIRYDSPMSPCSFEPIDLDTDVVIKVSAPTIPVAPLGHGGFEEDGWRSYADDCQSVTHPPFPIRMIERVSIEGVRVNGQQPKVLIDEDGGSEPFSWGSTPIPKRSLFHAATSARLKGFEMTGTLYFKKLTDKVNAVFAEGVSGFTVANCLIDDLFDGIYFSTSSGVQSTTATVEDSILRGLGPVDLSGSSGNNQNQGHAGAWLKGPGNFMISFSGVRFEGCHDAIEIAGTVDGEHQMEGRLSITNCVFEGNENGLEAVGSGALVAAISDCEFVHNHNFLDGSGMPLFLDTGAPFSPAAIAARNGTNDITVRSSTFFNNSFALLANSPGNFDFGVNGDNPGNNVFDLDYAAFTNEPDPLRVMMYVKDQDAEVVAGGNTWYHENLNQGTDSAGCLTGFFTGPATVGLNLFEVVLVDTSVIRAPPGPDAGECCEPGTSNDWKRNFSLDPAASIDFGTECLP